MHDLIRGAVILFVFRGIARGIARTLREEVHVEVGTRERSRKADILEIVICRLGIFTFMDADLWDVGAAEIRLREFGDIERGRGRAQAIHPRIVDDKVFIR